VKCFFCKITLKHPVGVTKVGKSEVYSCGKHLGLFADYVAMRNRVIVSR